MSEQLRPQSLAPFYASGYLPYVETFRSSSQLIESGSDIARVEIEAAKVGTNIKTLSEQNKPASSGPYRFERRAISVPNARGTVHFWSTNNAGGRTNPPNLVDAAVYATVAEMYGHGFTYWALPGNSQTSGMSRPERMLYAQTGSLLKETEEGVKPTDYAEAWAQLIAGTDAEQHLFSKGHGGIFATAIGVALQGQGVKTTLQIERPGLVDVNGQKLLASQTRDELQREDIEYEPDDMYGPHRNTDLLKASLAPEFHHPIWHFVNNPSMLLAHIRAAKRGPQSKGVAERDLAAFRTIHPNADMRFITSAGDVTSAIRQQQMDGVEYLLRTVIRTKVGKGYVECAAIPGSRKSLSQAPQVVAAIMAETLQLADAA